MRSVMTLQTLLGIEHAIVQAPMAGVQDSALAIAVSQRRRARLAAVRAALAQADARRAAVGSPPRPSRPYNVNFFCHTPPVARRRSATPPGERCSRPYYRELGLDLERDPNPDAARTPFSDDAADVLSEFKPPVVSFHFGLPSAELLARVQQLGREDPVVGDDRRRGALARSAWRRRDHRAGPRGRRSPRHVSVGRRHDADGHAGAAAADRRGGDGAGDCGRRHRRRERRRRGDGARRGRRPGRNGLSAVSGSDDQRGASGGAEERGGAAHRAHQRLHRPAGARHREPAHARARTDQRCRPGVSAGRPPPSRRCARRPRASAAAISHRCGRDRMPAAARRFPPPISRASWPRDSGRG